MRAIRKNQQNESKNDQQASRRLRITPPKLRAILELVNIVPPEVDLPDVYSLWTELNKQRLEAHREWYELSQAELQKERESIDSSLDPIELNERLVEYSQKLLDFSQQHIDRTLEIGDSLPYAIEALNRCVGGLPKKVKNHVWQEAKKQLNSEWGIYDAMARYTFVRESREKLRIISRLESADNATETAYLLAQLKTHAAIRIDEEGNLYVARDRFADAIDGVEASRIRECSICHHIFWAGRKTQQACSTACAHALRNRRYRARYKDYLVRQYERDTKKNQLSKQESETRQRKT